MSVATRLADLAARGVHFHLEGGELRFRGPSGALTDADKAALRAEKPAIVAYLEARALTGSPQATPDPGAPLVASLNQQVWWDLVHGLPAQLRMEKVPLVLPFTGADPAAAAEALRALVARHDVLRSRLFVEAGELKVALNPAEDFEVEIEAVADAAEAQARAMALIQAPLPVDGPWLARGRVYDVDGSAAVVALVCHHIVFDGSSMGLAAAELNDRIAGFEPERAPAQFTDYARWERRWFEGDGVRLAGWWRDWLDGLPALRSPGGGSLDWRPGARVDHPLTLAADLSPRLEAAAGRFGVSVFVLVLCAFGLALGRWSGQGRFPIRCVGDLRTSQALADAMGLLICHDPLEIDLEDGDIAGLANRVAAEYRSSVTLRLPPHPSGSGAGFEEFHGRIGATVNYIPAGAMRIDTKGPPIAMPIAPNRAQVLPWPAPLPTLFLRLWDGPEGLAGRLEFNGEVVSAEDQAALVAAFGEAIEAVVA